MKCTNGIWLSNRYEVWGEAARSGGSRTGGTSPVSVTRGVMNTSVIQALASRFQFDNKSVAV